MTELKRLGLDIAGYLTTLTFMVGAIIGRGTEAGTYLEIGAVVCGIAMALDAIVYVGLEHYRLLHKVRHLETLVTTKTEMVKELEKQSAVHEAMHKHAMDAVDIFVDMNGKKDAIKDKVH